MIKDLLVWNTGRQYTAEGQWIAAGYVEEEQKIYFYDVSRVIFGAVDVEGLDISASDIKFYTMDAYDNMTYINASHAQYQQILSDAVAIERSK